MESRIYFLGLNTAGSAARKAFPAWLKILGVPGNLILVDLPRDSARTAYAELLDTVRGDAHSVGLQVTSHKVRIYDYLTDSLDSIDEDARMLGAIGAVTKTGQKLAGFSPDTLALKEELPVLFTSPAWLRGTREIVILGAGGAGRSVALASARCTQAEIAKITITEKSKELLKETAFRFHDLFNGALPNLRVRDAGDNDDLIRSAGQGTLIVNATGLGKDSDGSPVTLGVPFPCGSIVWDLNYRGKLNFLQAAWSQRARHELTVIDGWNLSIRNWFISLTRMVCIKPAPELFADFSAAASEAYSKRLSLVS